MIRVLIAEDELPLLRGIKNMIESLNPSFRIVKCAKNGKEALEYMKEYPVDVVFTDINMPIMDGLEILKYIAEKGKKITTVIISGYNDFSYAQQAIRYGAKNYLLKPVDKAELSALLKELQEELEESVYEEKNKILTDILFGNSDWTNQCFEEEITALYFCAGALTSYLTEELSPGSDYWVKNNLRRLANKILKNEKRIFCFYGNSLNDMIMILEGTGGKTAEEIALKILEDLDTFLPVTAIYGKALTDPRELKAEFHMLRKEMRKRAVFGESILINREPRQEKYTLEQSQKTVLEFAVKKEQVENIKSVLLEIKEQMKRMRITQKNLEDALKEILIVISKIGSEEQEFELSSLEADVMELIVYSPGLDSVFEDFYILCKGIIQGEQYEGGKEIMKRVDEYIRNHIAGSLTTKMLAAKFGLVAPYLSELFKNYKGETPSQYIQNIRIANAKNLLIAYPDMLAKDVAETVGYGNPLYFSKTFKKNVGVYPSEYRVKNNKQNSKQEEGVEYE